MDSQAIKYCDLVMEGGGVKSIGLSGALTVLSERGYRTRRVAGTSAGAIVGSMVAAGMPAPDVHIAMAGLDYPAFRDKNWMDRFGPMGMAASLAVEKGVFEGRYVHKVVDQALKSMGVRTFADLKITESWAHSLPPEQRYKLVVMTADVTSGRLVRLPWDYHLYGLDPDKQRVADAVRASVSIPFFYKPVKMRRHLFVDGAILSNFPIDLFDNTAEWPTIGIKLWETPEQTMMPAHNTLEFAQAILATMLNAQDQQFIEDPAVLKRTIFVNTDGVKPTNFDIKIGQLERLYLNGRNAAEEFLRTWDYEQYKKEFAPHLKTAKK